MRERPEPTAEGQLSRTPFAHVLLYVRERQLTGTIAVSAPDTGGELAGESLLCFETGCLTQARLPTIVDPLGFVLREMAAISDDQLNESLARLAHKEGLQGEILQRMGACDDTQVMRALRTQVRRKALRLFALRDAPYAFYDGVDLLAGWGGSRVREDVLSLLWRGVRGNPDARSIDTVLAKTTGQAVRLRPGVDLRVFEFDRNAQGVIDTLRYDAAPLESLLSAAQDQHLARAMLYVLLISKQAEIVPLGTRAERATPPRPTANASVEPPPPSRPVSRPSIPPRASMRPSLPPDITTDVRDRYDEALARLAAMEDENFYQMLGVAPSASTETIHAAYLEQAARWHPDRAPGHVPSLRQLHERVFAYISEAQDTLNNPDHAGRYLRMVQDGGGTPSAQRKIAALIDAATDAQKAEVCLRRREYDEAERLARKSLAVAADDPNSLCVLAAALIERRADVPPTDEAMRLLSKAVEVAPKHDRARVQYGTALKRLGDTRGALEQFQAALAANPKNMDAQREVRLADMRASRSSGPSITGSEPAGGDAKKKLQESFIGRFLKK